MKPIKFHAVDNYTIETANYGLYIASTEVVYSWLTENKLNRRKKLLQHLQNNHSIYLESIRKGIWLPIVPIDSVSYKVYVNSEPSGPCKKVFCYTGFNLQVGSKNDLWIGDIGELLSWDAKEFTAEHSSHSYKTLDGDTIQSSVRIPGVNAGAYNVAVAGYIGLDDLDTSYCYSFYLDRVTTFTAALDPREDDKYTWNISQHYGSE